MKVKEMPKHDRPREKLERYGITRLSEHELLALLLGLGSSLIII
jgi:DNA repair protein RadC